MPVGSTIDDDLTDLSWLVQMNNNQKNVSLLQMNSEAKTKTCDRFVKPLAVVNGQSTAYRPSLSTRSHRQYSNEENQLISQQTTIKRKHPSSYSYQNTKRFHNEQTLPISPTSNDLIYYEQIASSQRATPSLNGNNQSRFMLWKNDPSLSETIPTVPMSNPCPSTSKMLEDENIFCDDIDHLLDIFKNEVELIGFDPIGSSAPSSIDIGHCLSSNEFCSY